MKFPIMGASPVTEYQLVKFTKLNGEYREDILSLYIKYALEFNIQVDFAYLMCLLYTDFFRNPIEGNNIVGIGLQEGGTKMEEFSSIEQCVLAHYEILRKSVDESYESSNKYSNLIRRITPGCISTREESFTLWMYDELTKYTIYEANQFTLEMLRTRNYDVDWDTGSNFYYYIRVKTSTSKSEILQLRSELGNKKFDKKQLFITASDGKYNLEMGRYTNPAHTNTLLQNLQMYGYNGEVCFRRL